MASLLRYPRKFGSSRNAYAGGDDDVDVSGFSDLADPGDVPAEPGSGRIDDRANPSVPHALQLRHRVRDPLLLVPVERAERVPPVLECLRLQDEYVLVHERSP